MNKKDVVAEVQYELKMFDRVTKRKIEKSYDRLSSEYGDFDDLVQAIADDIYNS